MMGCCKRGIDIPGFIYIYKGKVIPLRARCGPELGRGIALLFHDRGTRRG